MNLGLKNKVVLVSGASRGIGFAIATAFAAEGARVVLTARDAVYLNAVCDRLIAAAGRDRILALPADMANEEDVARVIETAESAFGPITAAIASAGSGSARNGVELGRSDWEQALDANLMPAVLLAGAVLPRMAKRRNGSLTIISSIAGIEAIQAPIPYSSAKAALNMAVKCYAQQLGKDNVRVNALAPGNVFFPGGTWAHKYQDKTKKELFLKYIRSDVALQRFATPREIADLVVFLASARASFITGSILVADGGQLRSA
jgi:3-oxoacyl-[acyl-carrier protein] reductase